MRVGIDLVQVSGIESSLATFGERFLRRVFTAREVSDADAAAPPRFTARHLAARFAAKEATMKALDLGEHGVGWRDIEVTRAPSGMHALELHGAALEALRAHEAEHGGQSRLRLSLSQDGDYAAAIVVLQEHPRESEP